MSWITVIASVVDLFASLPDHRQDRSPEEIDAAAMASDWRAVGMDLKSAAGLTLDIGPQEWT